MPKDPETDDEEELAPELFMPRDPSLPATQILETPEARKEPNPSDAGLDFDEPTQPQIFPSDERTLDEPMPPAPDSLEAQWEQDLETAVDDPTAESEP